MSFVSYQFYTCYIYLDIVYILFAHNLFGQLSSLRNTSEHIMLWVSFFCLLVWSHSSCKCPYSFRFVIFQYFHSYVVSYFMLFHAFNNVSCVLNFRWTEVCSSKVWMRVISVCSYILYLINLSIFSLPFCQIMCGYFREKLHVNHFWELKG